MMTILAFCILFTFHQLSPHKLNKGSYLMVNEGFYFLLHTKACFSVFYIGLLFTSKWLLLLTLWRESW